MDEGGSVDGSVVVVLVVGAVAEPPVIIEKLQMICAGCPCMCKTSLSSFFLRIDSAKR
jgi:hypothetical protein